MPKAIVPHLRVWGLVWGRYAPKVTLWGGFRSLFAILFFSALRPEFQTIQRVWIGWGTRIRT
jgi:hypothetical protein